MFVSERSLPRGELLTDDPIEGDSAGDSVKDLASGGGDFVDAEDGWGLART